MESPFVGDSEMARRMREVDWAATPLGSPDDWPAPLRTTVGLLLRSQLPMYVAWGPQWQLLYNDAYAPLLAARHPKALGAPFATTWPEVWPALRPAFEEVLAGTALFQEDLLMVLERRGYPEEAYFTFSVSAAGEPGTTHVGAFCACTETTEAVVGERRLRALGELGELVGVPDVETACAAAIGVLAAHRADVPAALMYLLDDDRSVARLVAAEGVDPVGALAPGTVDLDSDTYWAPTFRQVADSGRTAVVTGLAGALPGGRLPGAGPVGTELADAAPFDTAVVMRVPVAEWTAGLLVCAVSPHLPLHDEYRAFLELVRHHISTASTAAAAFAAQRRRTEELAEAERRFRTMADSTPALIWADDPRGERLFVNRGWVEFTGAEADADLGVAWRDRIHPADRERYAAVREGADGGPFEVEYRLRAADGRHRWVLDRGAPAEGYAGGYVGGCLDIHTRVAERERERLLAVVGSAMDRETTLAGRRATLVRTIVDEGLVDLARFVAVETGTAGNGIATPGPAAARTPELESATVALDGDWGEAVDVVVAGGPQQFEVDEEFAAGGADERQRELRRSVNLRTIVLAPLAARGVVSGLLAAARTRDSAPFDDDDLELFADLGERAATALDNALLLEREQATRARLELLQHATAALSAAATPQQVAVAAAEQFALLAQARAVTLWRLTVDGDERVLEAVDLGERVPVVSGTSSRIALADTVAPAEAARSGSPVWADPVADPGSADCVPLVAAGTCVGVVGLVGHPRDVRTGAGRAALTVLAKLCAQALQRSGLLAAESVARRTAEELGEVVGALSGATTPVDVAEVVLDHAVRLGATSAAVLVRTAEHLDVLAARNDDGAPWPDRRLSIAAPDPAAQAARTGDPVWADTAPAGTRVAVPLVLGGPGRPLGVIALRFAGAPRIFAARERAAVVTLAGQCAQALDRARLHQAEHDLADVLQRSLLPSELPALPRLSVAARYLPSAVGVAAGGDWYDLLPIDEYRVALVVGDVVGHGASAAAVMGQLRSALAAYLLDGHNPAAALERLDRFARRVPGATGSTCVCLVLDCTTGELCWARAGHPPVLLLEPAGPQYLDGGNGTVLGVSGRPPYTAEGAVIEPGSSVVLYTDGLVERRGEVIDEGQERLARAAAAVRDLPPDALVGALVDDALADGTLGDAAQPDDVAVVAVRLVPLPLHGRLPAQPRQLRVMRRAVEGWAAAVGLSDDVLDDLQYALGEAAANAVEHAYADGERGDFTYALTYIPGPAVGVAVEVRDTGRWRPPAVDPGYRGRGVQVMRAVGEDVRIDRDGGGTTVTFRVPVPPVVPRRRTARSTRPSGQPVAVTTVPGSGTRTLHVAGDLDVDGAASARPALLAALAPGELVVDLCDTGYVSSTGVALLVEVATAAREHGTGLSLRVRPGSPLARVLHLTGLRTALPVVETS